MIFSKLIQKCSSDKSNPGNTSDLRNDSRSVETDKDPFFMYWSATFARLCNKNKDIV